MSDPRAAEPAWDPPTGGTPEALALARYALKQYAGDVGASLADDLLPTTYTDEHGDFDAPRLAAWIARHGLQPPVTTDLKQGARPAPARSVDGNEMFRRYVARARGER